MPALNPITHADPLIVEAVLALDPAVRAEERLQSVLWLWLSRYFSGAAFTTRAAGGGTQTRTFSECTVDFQESQTPEAPEVPVIHVVLPERKTQRRDYLAGSAGSDDDWTVSFFVKVPSTLAGTAMAGTDPGIVASRVAGELEWLLGSSEREALYEAGILRVKLEQPSTLLPTTAWMMRMVVMTCRTRREIVRKDTAAEETGGLPWYYGKVAAVSRPVVNAGLVDSGNEVAGLATGTLTLPFASAAGEYVWFATPAETPTKTSWAEPGNSLNSGSIGGAVSPGGNLFPAHAAVLVSGALYKVYLANYPVAIPVLEVE